ncbi:MAG: cytochrome c oxidase subunit 3 [Saprospiraceae bacterium]|nr:cytochrome c oxidase subunit 3 [Saprospiraceae bacterium]
MRDPSFRFHPHHVMLSLLLMGLSMLFLALSVAYIYSRVQHALPPIRLPWLFGVNTLILLTSSWTLIRAEKAYINDETSAYQRQLTATLVLSVLFLVMQMMAWYQLFQQDIFMQSNVSSAYVYALSILHFIHVIGGLPFLTWFVIQAHQKMKEPVSVLLYFSDVEKRSSLKLLTRYWHFLDLIWIFLILFLGINMLF